MNLVLPGNLIEENDKERLLMKHPKLLTVVLTVLASLQAAWAYSPIWNVDGWDADRLAGAGITVALWKHDQIGESPALHWVQVTYDSSKLPEDQNVLMTLKVTTAHGETVSACRAEHKKGDPDKLMLIFAVHRENIDNSGVEIVLPERLAEAAERDFGDPGLGGYSLRLDRIMELAGAVISSDGWTETWEVPVEVWKAAEGESRRNSAKPWRYEGVIPRVFLGASGNYRFCWIRKGSLARHILA